MGRSGGSLSKSRDLHSDREVLAVLRIRVSQTGELRYGDAVDGETERRRRFRSWGGLLTDVQSLVRESLERSALGRPSQHVRPD
jgi:hypothetical protein